MTALLYTVATIFALLVALRFGLKIWIDASYRRQCRASDRIIRGLDEPK